MSVGKNEAKRFLKEQGYKLRTIAYEEAVYWDRAGSDTPGIVQIVFNMNDLLRICDMIDEVCSDE